MSKNMNRQEDDRVKAMAKAKQDAATSFGARKETANNRTRGQRKQDTNDNK